MYSEKATKFCEIFTLLLSYVVPVKIKVKISQNFMAFSEYMNFTISFHPGIYHHFFLFTVTGQFMDFNNERAKKWGQT